MNDVTKSAQGNYLITMPDVGEGIAEVEIVEWNVSVGDTIEEDDLLCTVMTDKAAVEIPSPVDGQVIWVGSEIGEVMAVGADLIRLQVEGEGNAAEAVSTASKPSAIEPAPQTTEANSSDKTSPKSAAQQSTSTAPTAERAQSTPAPQPSADRHTSMSAGVPRPEGEKPLASPAVRQRARDAGVDLRYVRGSGDANRITHQDLDSFIAGHQSSAASLPAPTNRLANTAVEETKIIGLRRRIAAIMQDTMQRIPHFTYVEEIDVTELEALRISLNKTRREEQPKLTLLPFFIKALVKSLQAYPQMNSRFDDEAEILSQYGGAHIGIATQTPNGLVVPVVKHAETLDIWQAAGEVKRLADAARTGKASREELSGSTITLSSLGPMGGITTTPVINSPEVAIIGVNKIAKRPVWQDGGFIPRDIMNLSSSFDHRIIDGWDATQFIHHLKGLLESPATLFMED